MDSRFPEIRAEVNREEEDKKGGLAAFLSKLGFGGGGAGGGAFGAAGTAAGGAGLGGGILATKAGIIGLALIGTTVAGGLGVVGYNVFGPGADSGGGYSSLFEARPAGSGLAAEGGSAGGAGAKDGQSASLNYLVQANNKEGGEGAGEGEAAAPADATADASASASAPAADAVKAPTANNNAPSQGPAAKLGGGKFGSLSKVSTSGSGGGGSGASSSLAPSGGALLASARTATGGASSSLGAARAAGGGGRSARRVGGGSAMRQLQNVRQDHRGASSSQRAGSTYDGSSAGSEIGADSAIAAGGEGIEGTGTGQGANQGNPTPTDASDDLPAAPPKPTGVNVTPWQAALNTCLLLLGGAAMLNFAANKIMQTEGNADPTQASRIIAGILASIAIGLSIYALTLAAKIGGGHYAQPTQGALIAISATFMIAQSGLAIAGAVKPGILEGGMSNLPMMAGAAGLLAMVGAYMVPMKKFDSSLFQGGRPPDWDHDYKPRKQNKTSMLPSEEALIQYIASGPRRQRPVA